MAQLLIYILKSILYIHFHAIAWGTSPLAAAFTALMELFYVFISWSIALISIILLLLSFVVAVVAFSVFAKPPTSIIT